MRDRGMVHARLSTRARNTGRLGAAAAAIALLAAMAAAVPAGAKPVPNPEFEQFANCPAYVKGVETCIVARTTSGSFTLGNKKVPITKPITLQGGLMRKTEQFVPASNGETLSKTTLTVPGGLVGIEGLGGEVTATTELALPASEIVVNEKNLTTSTGTALLLPVKVKLGNPLLGNSCEIGSESNPVVLKLTTGTTSPPAPNKPITGAPGTFGSNPGGTIATFTGASLVDNSFAAPQTHGCGGLLELLVNPLVNTIVGLPAASGHNTAILDGTLEQASAKVVKKAHVLPNKEK
jgi:hypothetical protein